MSQMRAPVAVLKKYITRLRPPLPVRAGILTAATGGGALVATEVFDWRFFDPFEIAVLVLLIATLSLLVGTATFLVRAASSQMAATTAVLRALDGMSHDEDGRLLPRLAKVVGATDYPAAFSRAVATRPTEPIEHIMSLVPRPIEHLPEDYLFDPGRWKTFIERSQETKAPVRDVRKRLPLWDDEFVAIHIETNGLCRAGDSMLLAQAIVRFLMESEVPFETPFFDSVGGSWTAAFKSKELKVGLILVLPSALAGAVASNLFGKSAPPPRSPEIEIVELVRRMPCTSFTVYTADGTTVCIKREELLNSGPAPRKSAPTKPSEWVGVFGAIAEGRGMILESEGAREVQYEDRRRVAWPLFSGQRYHFLGEWQVRGSDVRFIIREARLL